MLWPDIILIFFSKNDFEQNKKSTDLVIYCDSNQQNMLGVKEAQSYEQIGHTFLVSSNDLSDNSAKQYFYKNEIFAIMPTNKNNLFTVVWSIPKAHASSDKESIKRSLSKISKKFNLKLELESEIVSFPCRIITQKIMLPGQCVLADAAHSIHPLAGQGLNLGIADASVLLEELVRARNANLCLEISLFLKDMKSDEEQSISLCCRALIFSTVYSKQIIFI